jgi:AcrR family transcriptional regulator
VHRAVAELLAENGHQRLRVSEVARRSGVHPATIYRRWGTAEALALEVAAARLDVDSPVPSTSSLVSDLVTYAARAARSIQGPQGLAFLRATIAAGDAGDTETLRRAEEILVRRGSQLEEMLRRSKERGEPSLSATDVVDGIVAPIYLRTIFGIGGVDRAYLLHLVEAVIRGAVSHEAGRGLPSVSATQRWLGPDGSGSDRTGSADGTAPALKRPSGRPVTDH